MLETLPISISFMTPSDNAICLDIHEAAFASDQCSNLMNIGRPKGSYAKRMQLAIDGWFGGGNHLIKATDVNTGSIVGWAVWKFHWYDDNKTEDGAIALDEPNKLDRKSGGGDLTAGAGAAKPIATKIPTPLKPQQILGQRISTFQIGAKDDWLSTLPDKKYMSLDALAVSPTYQSRGVGSALVHWGTGQADIRGVPCWLDASPAGKHIYARAGFREIGGNDYDLSEFAPGGKEGKKGWGIYRFVYMVRDARKGGVGGEDKAVVG